MAPARSAEHLGAPAVSFQALPTPIDSALRPNEAVLGPERQVLSDPRFGSNSCGTLTLCSLSGLWPFVTSAGSRDAKR
jgi:hypothetical protein